MFTRLTLVLVCAVLYVGPYSASGADDAKRGGLSLAVEVVEPVILGHPFRMRGFATNDGDVARQVRVDQSDIKLVLGEENKNTTCEIFDGYWQPAQWQKSTVVPPGKRVALFDCMVPTGLRWGTGCISLVGKPRISCQAWVHEGDRYSPQTVKSKDFEIRLEPVERKDESFSVKGLLVEIRAAKQKVTSIDEVVFVVKLKNVGDQAIRISGREEDNFCHFSIYAPGNKCRFPK